MDTTVMEYTAEDLIAHKLQRGGMLVAKPKFDQDGADLLALLTVEDRAKFCRIQCKGRTLRQSSTAAVDVFADYVTNAFILFLFVETGDSSVTNLFAFFGSEIRAMWPTAERNGRPIYRLTITEPKVNEDWEPYRFTDSRVESIKHLIRHASRPPLLDCGVESAELDPGIGGGESPLHAHGPVIPLALPSINLVHQLGHRPDPPVQALPG